VAGIFFQFAAPDERSEIFEKIKDSLKPGGLLIIQGYGQNQLKYNTGGTGKLDHLYDNALMREAFTGYDVLVCDTYETSISEGAGHSGISGFGLWALG
jgi:hypothetical protein